MNDAWEKALTWLAGEGWKESPEGRIEIAGTKVYAIRSSYQTKPLSEIRYEAHRRYADIQVVLEGIEVIMVADTDDLRTAVPYDMEKDAEFLDGTPPVSHRLILSSPMAAAVLFPADAHQPGIAFENTASAVSKVVVKVRLD
jgi:YhcH/YjgK/YiaL family protein